MIIRQATLADRPRLIEMAVRFITETDYRQTLSVNRTQLEALVEYVLSVGVIFVGEHGADELTDCGPKSERQLAGMIALVCLPNPISAEISADELVWWVEPEYRSGTLGHKLLRTAEDWARRNGTSVLKMVSPAGSSVGEYYIRRGYTLVELVYHKTL